MFNLKSVLLSSVFAHQDFLKEVNHHHPKVQAAANRVTLDVKGHDYYGHLYIGKEYVENTMIYDTMR